MGWSLQSESHGSSATCSREHRLLYGTVGVNSFTPLYRLALQHDQQRRTAIKSVRDFSLIKYETEIAAAYLHFLGALNIWFNTRHTSVEYINMPGKRPTLYWFCIDCFTAVANIRSQRKYISQSSILMVHESHSRPNHPVSVYRRSDKSGFLPKKLLFEIEQGSWFPFPPFMRRIMSSTMSANNGISLIYATHCYSSRNSREPVTFSQRISCQPLLISRLSSGWCGGAGR